MHTRIVALLLGLSALRLVTPGWAGSPHFVGDCPIVSQVNTCITVVGKEAGLGDEDQITVTLMADAQCVNPGGNAPSAANKDAVATSVDVPVQNGKANYTLTGCAEFQPSCSPPMSVVFLNVLVTDETHGLFCTP